MKKNLILLFTFSLLISCVEKTTIDPLTDTNMKSGAGNVEIQKNLDTIYSYWELILDTVSERKDFRISDQKHILELKTFSLNDSSIVRNLGQGDSQVYLDHSHRIITEFILTTNLNTDQKRIDKTDFQKSLVQDFYKECNLFSTHIDSIVDQQIYLTSDFTVPDTDNQWRVWYSMEIDNNRLGKIEIKKTEYVGL